MGSKLAFIASHARILAMDEKDKKEYELAVLVKSEDDLASVVALIRQHNGEMASEPRAKKLALAYEIKKNKEAIFASCTFNANGADVKNIENDLNNKAEVIRFLVIIAPTPDAPGERDRVPMGVAAGVQRRTRTMRTSSAGPAAETKPAASKPLSNEALEKKIEEILQ